MMEDFVSKWTLTEIGYLKEEHHGGFFLYNKIFIWEIYLDF